MMMMMMMMTTIIIKIIYVQIAYHAKSVLLIPVRGTICQYKMYFSLVERQDHTTKPLFSGLANSKTIPQVGFEKTVKESNMTYSKAARNNHFKTLPKYYSRN
jgi:hypothetical protein